jgi:hypothetical protein
VAFVVGGYVILAALRDKLWRRGAFWQAAAIIAVSNLLIALPVVLPYFSSEWLGHAIEQTELRDGVDLMAYFTPAKGLSVLTPRIVGTLRHMEFADWQYRPFYLGLVTMAMAAVALIDTIRHKRGIWVWLALCIVFFSLSLGTTLRINDKAQGGIITPYALVQNNAVFVALREPHRFAMALLLPWSVLVGYGVRASLEWIEKTIKVPPIALTGIGGAIIAVMLFEIAQTPFGLWSFDGDRIAGEYGFIDRYGEGAIIDLPMGRGYSKYYMALQTIHRQPISEGMSARMPVDAYDTIMGNALTAAWFDQEAVDCSGDLDGAIEQLRDEGFRYVVAHRYVPGKDDIGEELEPFFDSVAAIKPVFENEEIVVFRVDDLSGEMICPAE